MKERGKFIVFEGIDGCGKTTIGKRIVERLEAQGSKAIFTFEPTKNPVGSLLREVITNKIVMNEQSIAALFVADRMDHVVNEEYGMMQLLNKGIHVICDRYYLSSYAYHVPYVSLDWVMDANSISTNLLRPDITFYLDIPVSISLDRIAKNRNSLDLFENEARINQVRENYLQAIEKVKHIDHIEIIDAQSGIDVVESSVWNALMKVI